MYQSGTVGPYVEKWSYTDQVKQPKYLKL